jgi:hypothetical protein
MIKITCLISIKSDVHVFIVKITDYKAGVNGNTSSDYTNRRSIILSDDTARMELLLWGEDINLLEGIEVNQQYRLGPVHVKDFGGKVQLAVRNGRTLTYEIGNLKETYTNSA